MKRKTPLGFAATLLAAIVAFAAGCPSLAQDGQVIRVLVGYPPGAGTDTAARIYAEALEEELGIPTMVDNKPGAGGQIAAQALRAASRYSNTIMFAVDHQVVMLPLVVKNPGYEVGKDMVPVGRIAKFYTCLAVPAASQARDFGDYLDLVRKESQQGNFGIPAAGSRAQFIGYVVSQHFKVSMNPVPYRGAAPAINDLLGGQVAAAIVPCDALIEYRKAGKLRILAIAADNRYTVLPDVPTFGELGVSMPAADGFLSVYASPTLRPELLAQIKEATRRMFDSSRVLERWAAIKMEPSYAGPEELRGFVEKATAFWAEQVRRSDFQVQ